MKGLVWLGNKNRHTYQECTILSVLSYFPSSVLFFIFPSSHQSFTCVHTNQQKSTKFGTEFWWHLTPENLMVMVKTSPMKAAINLIREEMCSCACRLRISQLLFCNPYLSEATIWLVLLGILRCALARRRLSSWRMASCFSHAFSHLVTCAFISSTW